MFESEREPGDGAGAALGLAPGEDVLAVVQGVLRQLQDAATRGRDAERWSPLVRGRVIGVLDRLAAVAAGVRAPVLVAQRRAAAAVGAERELADHRAQSTGVTRGQAHAQLAAAQKIVELEHVRAAVTQGDMHERHVQVLAEVMARAGEAAVSALSSEDGQARVVALARGSDPRQFGREVAAIAAAHEPDAFDDARAAARRERSLELSHTPRGTHLRGFLDPLAGQALQRALDATGHRPDLDRTAGQARADALAALAGHALAVPAHTVAVGAGVGAGIAGAADPGAAGGAPGPGDAGGAGGGAAGAGVSARRDVAAGAVTAGVVTAGVVPQVALLVPAEVWWRVRERQDARHRSRVRRAEAGPGAPGSDADGPGSDADGSPGGGTDRGSPGGEEAQGAGRHALATTEDGTLVSSDELAAALCDCAMTRVVMSAQGLPLDVGRSRRRFSPAQRLAVVARDRRCAWDGCGVVPAYCEVHHIRWWQRDEGETSVQNAVLLCSFHHHLVHERDLAVEREARPPDRPTHTGRAEAERPAAEAERAGLRPRYAFRRRDGAIHHPPDAGAARVTRTQEVNARSG